jgi:hypothetical protein
MTHLSSKRTACDKIELAPVSLTLLPSTLRALYHAAGSTLAGRPPDDPEAGDLRIFVRYVEARWPGMKNE